MFILCGGDNTFQIASLATRGLSRLDMHSNAERLVLRFVKVTRNIFTLCVRTKLRVRMGKTVSIKKISFTDIKRNPLCAYIYTHVTIYGLQISKQKPIFCA